MMWYAKSVKTSRKRILDLRSTLKQKSCFLFGPRQTGKSTLVEQTFPESIRYDLLESDTYRRLNAHPETLRNELMLKKPAIAVIDEIQKIPELLDEVHLLIEKKKINFLLTGSSPRKLKKKGVNLLGGRARIRYLHPYSCRELSTDFSLQKALNYGLLPSVYDSTTPEDDLQDYVGSYLQNEIANEGVTRNVPAFTRFLEVAALSNAKMLNYQAIGSDAEVKTSTVNNYFQILEDTLIGFRLEPWLKSKNRKAITTPKFYFFDSGVCRRLQGRKNIAEGTTEFGEFFETWLLHEVNCYFHYQNTSGKMNYWRSTSGFEVDLILNHDTAIEIKAKKNFNLNDLKGLKALKEEKKFKNYLLVAMVPEPLVIDSFPVIPYTEFIERLWSGEYD